MTGIPLEYEVAAVALPFQVEAQRWFTNEVLGIRVEGMKIRGLELRQHSTCPWVAQLQTRALEMLADADELVDNIPSYRVQCQIQRLLLDEVQRLEHHQLRAKDGQLLN